MPTAQPANSSQGGASGPALPNSVVHNAQAGSNSAEPFNAVDMAHLLHEPKSKSESPAGDTKGVASGTYDLFLTHNWGDDEAHTNHQRVARVNDALKERGFVTWFDGDRMTGDVQKQMCAGILKSRAVLVFVTERYMEKLDEEDLNPCQQEFNFAKEKKGVKYMIPIVMEKAMLTRKNWNGVLLMNLGQKIFVSMVHAAEIESNMQLVLNELAAIGITPSHGAQAPLSAAERTFAVDVAHLSREPNSKSEPPAGNAKEDVPPITLLASPPSAERANDASSQAQDQMWGACPQTTPLHDAAKEGRLDDVRRIIAANGADKDAKDQDGRTPLHLASENGKLDVVRYLVASAADVKAKTLVSL
eukprot:jgi/Mesvir1/5526/Mv15566-RA.2